VDDVAKRLVPYELWEITDPLIPASSKHAQGGGIARADDRQVFCTIAFVLTTGCVWRHLRPTFGVSHQTTGTSLT
jgi:transposase